MEEREGERENRHRWYLDNNMKTKNKLEESGTISLSLFINPELSLSLVFSAKSP
jgi:hypothetical protein